MSSKPLFFVPLSAALLLLSLSAQARVADREDEVRALEVSSSPQHRLRRPIVIDKPGKYVLRNDIHAADLAILIRADQVTLDLDEAAVTAEDAGQHQPLTSH